MGEMWWDNFMYLLERGIPLRCEDLEVKIPPCLRNIQVTSRFPEGGTIVLGTTPKDRGLVMDIFRHVLQGIDLRWQNERCVHMSGVQLAITEGIKFSETSLITPLRA